MISAEDLPQEIALFPLAGALMLPRAQMPLHIFEPRYRQMIEGCLATPTRLIGMIQPCGSPSGDPNMLQAIGCAGRLTSFTETEDGRYVITLTGISRFRLLGEAPMGDRLYRRGQVSWQGFERDLGGPEQDKQFDRDAFFELLMRYLRDMPLKADWQTLKEAEDEVLVNALSAMCPFSPEERQALLEAPSLSTRRETLVMLMEFALRGPADEDGSILQ